MSSFHSLNQGLEISDGSWIGSMFANMFPALSFCLPNLFLKSRRFCPISRWWVVDGCFLKALCAALIREFRYLSGPPSKRPCLDVDERFSVGPVENVRELLDQKVRFPFAPPWSPVGRSWRFMPSHKVMESHPVAFAEIFSLFCGASTKEHSKRMNLWSEPVTAGSKRHFLIVSSS